MSINPILTMGGYAYYVWPAYGVTLLVFGLNVLLSLRERHQVKKTVRHYLRYLAAHDTARESS